MIWSDLKLSLSLSLKLLFQRSDFRVVSELVIIRKWSGAELLPLEAHTIALCVVEQQRACSPLCVPGSCCSEADRRRTSLRSKQIRKFEFLFLSFSCSHQPVRIKYDNWSTLFHDLLGPVILCLCHKILDQTKIRTFRKFDNCLLSNISNSKFRVSVCFSNAGACKMNDYTRFQILYNRLRRPMSSLTNCKS